MTDYIMAGYYNPNLSKVLFSRFKPLFPTEPPQQKPIKPKACNHSDSHYTESPHDSALTSVRAFGFFPIDQILEMR